MTAEQGLSAYYYCVVKLEIPGKSEYEKNISDWRGCSSVFYKDLWDKDKTLDTTDKAMSMYTRQKHSPQGNYTTEQTHGKAYTQKHSVLPGKRADEVDQPFPSKPVSHRRPLNPGRQDPLDLFDFEKMTIAKQPSGPLMPQEPTSHGVRKTTGYQHPRRDSHRQPRGETQMAKAIHAKELMLQEKLWSVEEKIRQIIQKDSVACNDQGSEAHRHNRGKAERGNSQIKTRLSEHQRREPERREMTIQERRQEDKNTRGDRCDSDGHKGIHQISCHKQDVSGKLNKSRWENVKEQTRRRKGGDEKDGSICGETGVKLQDGKEKAKEREKNMTSIGDKGWMGEKTYRERTYKDGLEQATNDNRDAGRKLSDGPLLPPASYPSHPSTTEQDQLRQEDSTATSLQLQLCSTCNRKFASERLKKHVQICKKVKQSHRQVFNSYLHRTKGSAIEEFWKTHSRPISPEVLKKKNQRQNQKSHTRNLHEGRLPAGTSQPKWSK